MCMEAGGVAFMVGVVTYVILDWNTYLYFTDI